MIIAKEKRENNIAEYLLYMWQVEDLLEIGPSPDRVREGRALAFREEGACARVGATNTL